MTKTDKLHKFDNLAQLALEKANAIRFVARQLANGDPLYMALPDVPVFLIKSDIEALKGILEALEKALDNE
ncbi:MAG: hypothetical protein VR71_10020 [Roseovarius sp. BRH_c41]|uniref:hypothetical protein n=1 Tax=Roseovarius sp. BRH_c41 TaxID=1629709 RepID=UPI0005F224D7|nr:hypothetical protein [Roseovarius sp. BRH_c41]KJS43524.1 MAG: hypothetical protein VR71_10020 [Roseovarius sp. BRH_c41]